MLSEISSVSQFPETELLTWIRFQPGLADVLDHYSKDPRLVKLLRDVFNHHPETYAHSLRTSYVAFEIAKATNPDLALVCAGDGLFHDSGKVIVSRDTLQSGKLTRAQKKILRGHPRQSFELLRGINEGMALVAVAHHELHHPRGGYPRKVYRPLTNNEVIEQRRHGLVVADRVDAMMSKRPYKNAWGARRAARRLESFNPQWVQAAITARAFIETHGPN